MKGILYEDFVEYDTFIHAKSVFEDALYNYIVPKVNPDALEKEKVEDVIGSQKETGKSMTYYVHGSLSEDYAKYLSSECLGDDTFIRLQLSHSFDVSLSVRELRREDTEGYVGLAKDCFPDWDNEEKYTRLFLNLSDVKQSKIFKTFVLEEDGELAAFGSVVVDPALNLAYLHNAGTRTRSRKKGYFSEIAKASCNFAREHSASTAYGIVEEGGGSYRALSRIGFLSDERFFLYAPNN